jgi:hypothetical protein
MSLSRLALCAVVLAAGAARAEPLPTRVGACVVTTIALVETPAVDAVTKHPIAGSRGVMRLSNGAYQLFTDSQPAIEQSRPGDRMRLCYVSRPPRCPPGDARGWVFNATNLRTKRGWRLTNGDGACGG